MPECGSPGADCLASTEHQPEYWIGPAPAHQTVRLFHSAAISITGTPDTRRRRGHSGVDSAGTNGAHASKWNLAAFGPPCRHLRSAQRNFSHSYRSAWKDSIDHPLICCFPT